MLLGEIIKEIDHDKWENDLKLKKSTNEKIIKL